MSNQPLFDNLENLLRNYKKGCFVEIGAGSSSTKILANIAHKFKTVLYSVDPNPKAHKSASGMINITQTGEEFLHNFHDNVFFCYMDGYDWANHWEYPHIKQYQGCTKKDSEKSHLEQANLLRNYLTAPSYVLFDDTGIESSGIWKPECIMNDLSKFTFYGKGALAIPLLIDFRMKIIGYSPNSSHGGPNHQKDQILLELE